MISWGDEQKELFLPVLVGNLIEFICSPQSPGPPHPAASRTTPPPPPLRHSLSKWPALCPELALPLSLHIDHRNNSGLVWNCTVTTETRHQADGLWSHRSAWPRCCHKRLIKSLWIPASSPRKGRPGQCPPRQVRATAAYSALHERGSQEMQHKHYIRLKQVGARRENELRVFPPS